ISRFGGGSTPPPNRPSALKSLFDWGLSFKKVPSQKGGYLKSCAFQVTALGGFDARSKATSLKNVNINNYKNVCVNV
ncbi:hypothetical protein ABGT17_22885, partial [Rossellomorea marisflavi]